MSRSPSTAERTGSGRIGPGPEVRCSHMNRPRSPGTTAPMQAFGRPGDEPARTPRRCDWPTSSQCQDRDPVAFARGRPTSSSATASKDIRTQPGSSASTPASRVYPEQNSWSTVPRHPHGSIVCGSRSRCCHRFASWATVSPRPCSASQNRRTGVTCPHGCSRCPAAQDPVAACRRPLDAMGPLRPVPDRGAGRAVVAAAR